MRKPGLTPTALQACRNDHHRHIRDLEVVSWNEFGGELQLLAIGRYWPFCDMATIAYNGP